MGVQAILRILEEKSILAERNIAKLNKDSSFLFSFLSEFMGHLTVVHLAFS